MGAKVPMVLIYSGSTLNVCPFRTTLTISLEMETIISFPLTVRAYDNTLRKIMGTFKDSCKIGPTLTIVEFHVMDITSNYNFLLGKGLASPQWGDPLLATPKDEDPMEMRDCHSAWRQGNSSTGLWARGWRE